MNIAFLLDRLADSYPGKSALIDDARPRDWAMVRDRVRSLAGLLSSRGIGQGDRVAILMANRPEFAETMLACAWLGVIAVPVNTRLAAPEVTYQLDNAGARFAFFDASNADLLQAAEPGLPSLSVGDEMEAAIAAASPVMDLAMVPPDHTLGLFYTGGTTGLPKGVMLSHNNMLANSANIAPQLGFAGDDVQLHAAPMFHLADLGATFGHLFGGPAKHVFMPAFDPDKALALIEQHGVTSVMLAPTMIGMLLRAESIGSRDLSSIRIITYGGAPIADSVMREAMQVFPGDLVQGFGQTEATQTVCYMLGDEHRRALDDPGLLRRCGRPIPGIQVRILDDEDTVQPTGATGEVAMRGATVMTGYWNMPEATAEALRNGWLHTGDIGMLDDEGFLTLIDRKKDMIVTGAENVYSPEVENAVASHPAVAECAVVGIPDERWGETIHAVVQLKPSADADAPDAVDSSVLEAHCRERIAGFKIPRSWAFVDELPKTAFGKIQKNALREPFWKGRDRQVN